MLEAGPRARRGDLTSHMHSRGLLPCTIFCIVTILAVFTLLPLGMSGSPHAQKRWHETLPILRAAVARASTNATTGSAPISDTNVLRTSSEQNNVTRNDLSAAKVPPHQREKDHLRVELAASRVALQREEEDIPGPLEDIRAGIPRTVQTLASIVLYRALSIYHPLFLPSHFFRVCARKRRISDISSRWGQW